MNTKRRHEFKSTHSLRKYFETHAYRINPYHNDAIRHNNMPLTVPSALSISTFDGKKLLVVMTILAVVLTVESSIGYIL